MELNLMEIGVQLRKFVIFAIRKSVCSHPFLVGMVFCLIFLYRSFPFVFSLLVSASPVLVCTAVLLGTLLSFGQPNIPEIEKDELKTATGSHEIVSLKTGVSRNDAIVLGGNDESHSVERYTEKSRDLVSEKSLDEPSPVAADNKNVEVDKADDNLLDHGTRIKEKSMEIQFENLVSKEADREFGKSGFVPKSKWNDQKLGYGQEVDENEYPRIEKVDEEKNLELENGRSPRSGDSFDMQRAGLLDSPLSLQWKQRMDEEGEGEDDDDEDLASDSGSDRAESSSPDASMADIIPMLDELHPLLDEDASSQPARHSHEGYIAVSEHSPKSVGGSDESDNGDSEIQEVVEVGDDDNDEDDDEEEEEEEETHGGKEDGAKDAITWTEDDQKNLMDLGSSELERNQRLESLIARRRLRKSMKMMAEENLIDLDGVDLHFNVAPISTARKNPFDLPHDSNDNMALPPIPGSAPSILAPRRNPFDLPYDSGEEKLDLMEDSFQQEFIAFQRKELFFRRHESFNVGPLFFGHSKQENQGSKLRPIFVPERMDFEGTSNASFQRQLSELSDSKVSSVPETESVSSAEDLEEKKLIEEDISQGAELILSMEHVAHDMSSELSGFRVSIDPETELLASAGDLEHKNLIEEDISQEAEVISDMEVVSQHVTHGSQSSDNVDFAELGEVKNRDAELEVIELKLGNATTYHEKESGLSETGSVASPVDLNGIGIHVNAEADQTDSSRSGSSSSEMNDEIFTENEGERSSSLEARAHNLVEEPGMSTQPSPEEADLTITSGLVDDTHHKEPVYDSSPRAVEKTLSPSISSDLHGAMSEMGLPPVVNKRTVSFADDESELSNHGMEKDIGHNTDMLPDPVQVHAVRKNEFVSNGVTEISEHSVKKFGFSEVNQSSDSLSASMVPQIVHNQGMENDTSSNKEIFPDSSELHVVHDTELGSREITDVAEHEEVDRIAHSVIASPASADSSHGLGKDTPNIKEIPEADLLQLHAIGEEKLGFAGVTGITEDNANAFEILGVQGIVDSADALMVHETLEPNHGMENDSPSTKEILEDSSKLHAIDESELGSSGVTHVAEHEEDDGISSSVNISPESVVHNHGLEKDAPSIREILEIHSAQLHTVGEHNLVSSGVTEITGHDAKEFGTSGVDRINESADALTLLETLDPKHATQNDSPSNKEILAESLELHAVCESELGSRRVADVIEHAKADSVNPLAEVAVSNHGMENDTASIKEIVEADSLQLHVMGENRLDSVGVTEINEHDTEKFGISGVDRIADGANVLLVPETLEPNGGMKNDPPSNEEVLADSTERQVAGESESVPRAATNVTEHKQVDRTADSVNASREGVASNHETEDTDSIKEILAVDSSQSDAVAESKLDSAGFSDITEDDTRKFGIPSVGRTADSSNASMVPETSESNLEMEDDTPSVKEISTVSSELHVAGENELMPRAITEVSEHDTQKVEITVINQNSDGASSSMVPESVS